MGAETQENFLAQDLEAALRQAGCHVFHRASKQTFTKLDGAGNTPGTARLLCARRVLGRRICESVTRHSELLTAFNRPIDLRHTYVLRADAPTAAAVMERMGGI
jgi:hypothetical protein